MHTILFWPHCKAFRKSNQAAEHSRYQCPRIDFCQEMQLTLEIYCFQLLRSRIYCRQLCRGKLQPIQWIKLLLIHTYRKSTNVFNKDRMNLTLCFQNRSTTFFVPLFFFHWHTHFALQNQWLWRSPRLFSLFPWHTRDRPVPEARFCSFSTSLPSRRAEEICDSSALLPHMAPILPDHFRFVPIVSRAAPWLAVSPPPRLLRLGTWAAAYSSPCP